MEKKRLYLYLLFLFCSLPLWAQTSISLPYSEDFVTEDAFSAYTVVDANGDGTTWRYLSGRVDYKYNVSHAADDWFITPTIHLESGKKYLFSIKASNTYPEEKFRVCLGNEPTAEALTTELVPVTSITGLQTQVSREVSFRVDVSGDYYIGVQACSDADMSELYVDEISLKEIAATTPQAPENLTAVAGERGARMATLRFDMPTKQVDGSNLTGALETHIYRGDKLIASLGDFSAGETACTYVDNTVEVDGMETYSVMVQNASGEGEKASCSLFVGKDAPAEVTNVKIREGEAEDGTVIISWDPPVRGQHGGYVDTEGMSYRIFAGLETVKDLGTATSYTDTLDISKGQTYQAYSIYAENSEGSGRHYWVTVQTVAGPSKKLPFGESFAGVSLNSGPWLTNMTDGTIGEAHWDIIDGSTALSRTQDGDGGVAVFSAESVGKSARFESPKVSLQGSSNPVLTFWYYASGASDSLIVEVSQKHETFVPLARKVMSENRGWQRMELNLTDYKNSSFIQIGFRGVALSASKTPLVSVDNISIRDNKGWNLALDGFTAPKWINVGSEATFTVNVANATGEQVQASDYQVELLKNGAVCATANGVQIPLDGNVSVSLKDTPTISDAETSVYKARIVSAKDAVADDNESDAQEVVLLMPSWPAVADLTGYSEDDGIHLLWTEPDYSDVPADAQTDDIESYEDFAISNIGNWTMVDGDGANTIQLTLNIDDGPLTYPNAGKPMAFQVFNSAEAGIPFSAWQPHSGSRMFASFHCTDGTGSTIQSDDWAISPELNGKEQTVRFFAKVGLSGYVEELQFLVSSGSKDVADFTQVGETMTITNYSAWEEYLVKIPAGTKYFALRCVSADGIALLIDDISFVPADAAPVSLQLEGYNVYRDGKKINSSLVDECTYRDTDVAFNETYTYRVTAVYDRGESVLSNAYTATSTGIAVSETPMARISTDKHAILINSASNQRISIYAASGMRVYAADGSAQTFRVVVPAGVYIVQVGGKRWKVMVK